MGRPPTSRRVGRKPSGVCLGTVVSASNSTVAAATPIDADNTTTSAVTITVKDSGGGFVIGVTPTIAVTGTGNTITQPGATNSSGLCSGNFKTSAAGTKTVTVTAGGVDLNAVQVVCNATGGNTATLTAVYPPYSHPNGGGTGYVTGTNFTAGDAILIGGTAATGVTVTSSTRIDFTFPAGTARGIVDFVHRRNATDVTLSSAVLYTPNYTQIVDEHLEGRTAATFENSSEAQAWFLYKNTDNNYCVTATDTDAPVSPSDCLDWINPVGSFNGTSPVHDTDGPAMRMAFATNKSAVFVAFPFKVNSGWQYPTGSGVTKICLLGTNVAGNAVILSMLNTSAPAYFGGIYQNPYTNLGGLNGYSNQNIEVANLTDGNWCIVAGEFIASTGGAANGTLRIWLWRQGDYWRKTTDKSLKYATSGDAGFTKVYWQEVCAVPGGKTQTDHIYFDNFYISAT